MLMTHLRFQLLSIVAILGLTLPACAHSVNDGTDDQPTGQNVAVNPGNNSTNGTTTAIARFPRLAASAVLKWTQEPTENSKGSFTLYFITANGQPIAIGSLIPQGGSPVVAVKLWMPSMGHGSSPVTVSLVDAATVLVNDVYFVMPGDWEIRIQIKNGSSVIDEASIAYEAHN